MVTISGKVPLSRCSVCPVISLYKRLIWAASLRAHTPPATMPHEDPSGLVGEGELPTCWRIKERAHTERLSLKWACGTSCTFSFEPSFFVDVRTSWRGVMWMLLSCVCVHLLTGGYKLLSCCIIVEIHAWGSHPTSSRVTCWLLMKNGRTTRWRNDSSFLLKFLEAIQEVMEEWEFLFLVIHFLSSFFFLAHMKKTFLMKKKSLDFAHLKKKKILMEIFFFTRFHTWKK